MKNLINWNALSRMLTGSRHKIRKDNVPVRYRELISDIEEAVKEVLVRHGIN